MGFFILVLCAQDDYKSLVDKYCLVRDDFERKMTLAAKHFQEVESAHLKQMREFIESYCQIMDNNNNLLGRVRNIKHLPISYVLKMLSLTIIKIPIHAQAGRLSEKFRALHFFFSTNLLQFNNLAKNCKKP